MKNNLFPLGNLNPKKLREARVVRGLNAQQLGTLFGVQKQTIRNYELGARTPAADMLQQYVEKLNFPLNFFFDNDVDQEQYSAIIFRSMATSTQIDREALEIKARWMGKVYRLFEPIIDFPEVNVKTFRRKEPFSDEEIESIAKEVRQYWGLGDGPILNLAITLQNNGILISKMKVDTDKADACSFWRNGRPYIFLSSNKQSAVRSRFELAHELAHLILHDYSSQDSLDKSLVKRLDKEAHRFAGAFLLPRSSFAREVFSSSIDHFVLLKKRWKVAISAMIYRCSDLQILSESQVHYLWRQMAIDNIKRREPLDDIIPVEQPSLFSDSLELVLDNNLITKTEFVNQLNLPQSEIEDICNIEKDFLSENNEKSKTPHLRLIK